RPPKLAHASILPPPSQPISILWKNRKTFAASSNCWEQKRREQISDADRRPVGRSRVGRMVRVRQSIYRRTLGASSARNQNGCRSRSASLEARILRRLAQAQRKRARSTAAQAR